MRCRVQLVATAENVEPGYLTTTTYRLIACTLPVGPWSRVIWRDQTWAVVGEVAHRNSSPRTRHRHHPSTVRGQPTAHVGRDLDAYVAYLPAVQDAIRAELETRAARVKEVVDQRVRTGLLRESLRVESDATDSTVSIASR